MPITFPCDCGLTLSVRDEPPVYFVRCPKCSATSKVPHPKKNAKPEPPKENPGFTVVDDRASTAFDRPKKNKEEEEWEKAPYEKPTVKGGYEVEEEPDGPRGATKGTGRYEPHEVSQEEFDEEEKERLERRKNNKKWQAIALVVIGIIAIGALVFAGKATQMIDPGGNGRVGAGIARIAILFSMGVVALVFWVVRQIGEDD